MYYTLENKKEKINKNMISTYIHEEKKSKFISYIFNIKNEQEAKLYIDNIKKENKDARHVVYIYSILQKNNILNIHFSDDGEPQGTGTKAIYEFLNKEYITNVCIVVVRYFGGILLGAGPLARAYLNSVRGAVDNCSKKKIFQYIEKKISIKYNKYKTLKNDLKELINEGYVIINDVIFLEDVTINIKVEKSYLSKVNEVISQYIR